MWLMHSLMGAIEVCVDKGQGNMTEIERAVGLQVIAIRDTKEALSMLKKRKLGKREKAARPLLVSYLHMMEKNTLMRTWEKGLATTSRVGSKMDALGRDTTRFLQALNLVTHPNTPLRAVGMTVRKFKNNVEDLH